MDPLQEIINKITAQNLWERTVELRRNEYLKIAGSVDTNLYFVEAGSLHIFVMDELEEHSIRFGYPGNLIAALDSYIKEKPSNLYIQALKKTQLKVIGKSAFSSLVHSTPKNLELWLLLLGELVYQQMERERDLLTSSPRERYRRVLERSPQLFQEIPHRHIASYLRMTPETLSRIKKS